MNRSKDLGALYPFTKGTSDYLAGSGDGLSRNGAEHWRESRLHTKRQSHILRNDTVSHHILEGQDLLGACSRKQICI